MQALTTLDLSGCKLRGEFGFKMEAVAALCDALTPPRGAATGSDTRRYGA